MFWGAKRHLDGGQSGTRDSLRSLGMLGCSDIDARFRGKSRDCEDRWRLVVEC